MGVKEKDRLRKRGMNPRRPFAMLDSEAGKVSEWTAPIFTDTNPTDRELEYTTLPSFATFSLEKS